MGCPRSTNGARTTVSRFSCSSSSPHDRGRPDVASACSLPSSMASTLGSLTARWELRDLADAGIQQQVLAHACDCVPQLRARLDTIITAMRHGGAALVEGLPIHDSLLMVCCERPW